MSADKNIAIVMFQYSVVAKGIEKKLTDLGYHVDIISDGFDRMKTFVSSIGLFMFYLSEDITGDFKKTRLLFDMMNTIGEAGCKMISIGEEKFRSNYFKEVPEIRNYVWLNRPLNLDQLGAVVEGVLSGELVGGHSKRILIVDDDPSYAKIVREWIKDDYRVDIVNAGLQAMTFLLKNGQDNPVDLILLDYEMPVLDGAQVLQLLRQELVTRNIPVVFLTGNGTKEAVAKVMALKPSGYILKTTGKEALLEYLRNKLGN
jgi:CheY-like chemotaxis protein